MSEKSRIEAKEQEQVLNRTRFRMASGNSRYLRYILFAFFVGSPICSRLSELTSL
jgi:hypothetical protein